MIYDGAAAGLAASVSFRSLIGLPVVGGHTLKGWLFDGMTRNPVNRDRLGGF